MLSYVAIIAALAVVGSASPVAEKQQLSPRAERCNNNAYNCLLNYYSYQSASIQSYCTSFFSITTSTKVLTTTETSYDSRSVVAMRRDTDDHRTLYTKTVTKRDAVTTIADGSPITTTATQ